MWRPEIPAGGCTAKVSIAGSELAQRRQQLGRLGLRRSSATASTIANELPRSGSGISGQRREGHQAADRGHLLGRRAGPLVPGVQHLGGPLDREEERPGEDLGDRQQLELERGDDAEVAAAAAQRPEELRVVVGVDAPRGSPSASTSSIAVTAVALQAVLAAVPADPAAEAVADDPDRRRGAVAGGQAELRGLRDEVAPERPGADPGDPLARRRSTPCSAPRCGSAAVSREVAQRFGAVAGALGADPQPLGLRVLDRVGHVGRGLRPASRSPAGSWLSRTLKAPRFSS